MSRPETVQAVDVLALSDSATRLHLADGQSVDVPDALPSSFSPDEYAPSLLTFTSGPHAGRSFVIPDALRLPVMSALGYAYREGATLPTVEGVRMEGKGRAALLLRLPDGQQYAHRLPVPAAYALSGRRSEAIAGNPYTLTLWPEEAQHRAVYAVPFEVWPQIMPTLSHGEERTVRP